MREEEVVTQSEDGGRRISRLRENKDIQTEGVQDG
jgi:hypothetical protein